MTTLFFKFFFHDKLFVILFIFDIHLEKNKRTTKGIDDN